MDTPSLAVTRSDTDHRLTLAFYLLLIAISIMAMAKPAHAAGSVSPISVYPLTVSPVSGTLTYYGAADGYLNFYAGVPVGSDEEAVAWARVRQLRYSTVGFAKTGSGTYGGAHYSKYQDSIWAYPYQATLVVTQYVCTEGSNNGTPTWYTGHGMPNAQCPQQSQ
jgi:hypothetical protein